MATKKRPSKSTKAQRVAQPSKNSRHVEPKRTSGKVATCRCLGGDQEAQRLGCRGFGACGKCRADELPRDDRGDGEQGTVDFAGR